MGWGYMLNECEIIKILNKDALRDGLRKYLEIMDLVNKVDVSEDKDFQRLYNHFYRMGRRNENFYDVYYHHMEISKSEGTTFEKSLKHIHNCCGRYEVSFCSKLVATLDPTKPVWDSIVMDNLKLKKPLYNSKDREQKLVGIYEKIKSWYDDFMLGDTAKLMIQLFNYYYPDVNITDIKKVDLIIWQNR